MSGGAAAAQSRDDAPLQAFTRSSFYATLIDRALSSMPPDVFRRCPALVSTGSNVVVTSPVTFGADGFPNGGSWRQRFPVSGCGNDTVLNLHFRATADEKIGTTIAAPGDTHADVTLQNDAYKYVGIAVRSTQHDCASLYIKTTKFMGYELVYPPKIDFGRDHRSPPWWETWTVAGCGHTYDVPVDFIPDATGTQIYQPAHIIAR